MRAPQLALGLLGLSACFFDTSPIVVEHPDAGPSCQPWSLPSELFLDTRCDTSVCTWSAQQTPCVTTFSAQQDCHADWTVSTGGLASCSPTATRGPALYSADCQVPGREQPCPIDVYAKAMPRLAIRGSLTLSVRGLGAVDLPHEEDLARARGALGGAARIDRRLVVSRFSEGPSCQTQADTKLDFVDLQTFSVVATATAPPCLRRPLSTGSEMLAAFGGGPWELGRFDAAGRLLSRQPFRADTDELIDVSLDAASERGFFLFASTRDSGQSLLIQVESGLIRTSTTLENGASGVAMVGARRVAVAYGMKYLGELYDAFSLDQGTRLSFRLGKRGLASYPGHLVHARQAGRLVFMMLGTPPGLNSFPDSVVDIGTLVPTSGESQFYEWRAQPTAIALWPADPRLLIVAVESVVAPFTAAVALFDPTADAFLPGALPVGVGRISELIDDGEGGVVALLQDEASLVRVAAR